MANTSHDSHRRRPCNSQRCQPARKSDHKSAFSWPLHEWNDANGWSCWCQPMRHPSWRGIQIRFPRKSCPYVDHQGVVILTASRSINRGLIGIILTRPANIQMAYVEPSLSMIQSLRTRDSTKKRWFLLSLIGTTNRHQVCSSTSIA